ncbi:hypothetical protein ScPMuIL_018150 [Solemya velum]
MDMTLTGLTSTTFMAQVPQITPPVMTRGMTPISSVYQTPKLTNSTISPVVTVVEQTNGQPPRLSTDNNDGSSLQLEGAMMEQALDNVMSLPQVVDEVRQNQRGQSSEIHKQQQILKILQGKLRAVKEKNEDLLQEISSVKNRILFSEEISQNRSRSCKECQREIRELVTENENLEQQIKKKTEEKNEEKKISEEYKLKMKLHQEAVDKYESTAEVFNQLKELTDKVENLRSQYKEMKRDPEQMKQILAGAVESELQLEIDNIKEEKSVIEQRVAQKISQIEKTKDSQKQMEQTVKVLHKRNAAQLTRLKRQLKETQLHSRHWNDQVVQLQWKIAQAKQKLEE